jgi:hypothetical protein
MHNFEGGESEEENDIEELEDLSRNDGGPNDDSL